jgi:hypothetical protein
MDVNVHKTNVTMDRRKMRTFRKQLINWEEIYEFPIELKESHGIEALIGWANHATNPESISDYAKKKEYTEEEEKDYRESCEWAVSQILEFISDVVDTRVNSDKRRIARV